MPRSIRSAPNRRLGEKIFKKNASIATDARIWLAERSRAE
jgi:hypothetical protein